MGMENATLKVPEKQATMEVLVFSTSLEEKDISYVKNILDSISGITTWNVDLEDWEKVLRIETFSLESSAVIEELGRGGIFIKEMF